MMALIVKNTSRKLGAALEGVKCLICRLRAAMFNGKEFVFRVAG
jgi:hypothetical protein